MSAVKLALIMIDRINSESIQVSADKVGKKNQFDLVELAAQVEKADQFTRATAGSKLQIIAEQVCEAHTAVKSHLKIID